MTNDYWELITTEDEIINSLSVWALSYQDLINLVEINTHLLRIQIIPDKIIPRFNDYLGFIKSWANSQKLLTKVTGCWKDSIYFLELRNNMIEVVFGNLSPVIIDLDTHQLSVWVIDGGTGKYTLVSGLSPINYSKMISEPEIFPKFVRIGYEYKKGIYNCT